MKTLKDWRNKIKDLSGRQVKDIIVIVLLFISLITLVLLTKSSPKRCVKIRGYQYAIEQEGESVYFYNLGNGKIIELAEEIEVGSFYCYSLSLDK